MGDIDNFLFCCAHDHRQRVNFRSGLGRDLSWRQQCRWLAYHGCFGITVLWSCFFKLYRRLAGLHLCVSGLILSQDVRLCIAKVHQFVRHLLKQFMLLHTRLSKNIIFTVIQFAATVEDVLTKVTGVYSCVSWILEPGVPEPQRLRLTKAIMKLPFFIFFKGLQLTLRWRILLPWHVQQRLALDAKFVSESVFPYHWSCTINTDRPAVSGAV